MATNVRIRRILVLLLEYAVGLGILYWLFRRDALDLAPLRSLPLSLIAFGVVMALALNLLATVRVQYLLRDQHIFMGVGRLFFINCLGTFYSVFLPGGFSGDAARAYYLLRETPQRAELLGSLLLDRILGVLALIGLGTASSAFLVLSNPWLLTYFLYLAGLFVAGVGVLVYLLVARARSPAQGSRNLVVRAYEFVHNLIVRLNIHGHSKKTLAVCIGLSIVIHCLALLLLYVCSRHNDAGLDLLGVFSVGPFGMLANALPLTPGGLGVGEQSFEFLYTLIGGRNGASSFLTVRIFLYSPAIIGAIVAAAFLLRLQRLARPSRSVRG